MIGFEWGQQKYRGLKRLYRLVQDDRRDRRYRTRPYDDRVTVPDDALSVLRADNPYLLELQERYRQCDLPVIAHSQWSGRALEKINTFLSHFRGDSPYVWHYRRSEELTRLRYFIFLKYVASIDRRGLLNRLTEDGSFGCWHFSYPGYPVVSRDLLDSVAEINFLDRHWQIFEKQNLRILDIGAGYGRLATRMLSALPNIGKYTCTDAIAESTFLCDYFLKYCGFEDRSQSVPLDQWLSVSSGLEFDLAINIHSFSECRLVAVEWWLAQLRSLRVPWLMIVPNECDQFLTNEGNGRREDFLPAIKRAGYERVVQEAVFADDAVRELLDIHDQFFLFRLNA